MHPEYDYHDVHHHSAVANGDRPNQAHLQEVQGQCGGLGSWGGGSSPVQASVYWRFSHCHAGVQFQ